MARIETVSKPDSAGHAGTSAPSNRGVQRAVEEQNTSTSLGPSASSGKMGQTTGWAASLPWWIPVLFAIAVVIAYFFFVQTLIDNHGTKDPVAWERLMQIFRSIEVVVYAALGAIFGVAIQAPRVTAAQAEANNAKEETAKQTKRADAMERSIEEIQSLHFDALERSRVGQPDEVLGKLQFAIRNAKRI